MTAVEILKWSKVLLLKIHVITGWSIPENELLIILIDQFEKKVVEDYQMLNTDEIEFAFRSRGTTIEDWGKQMNLNLIDKVLLPYVQGRKMMEDRIKNLRKAKMLENFRKAVSLQYEVDLLPFTSQRYGWFRSVAINRLRGLGDNPTVWVETFP